MFISIIQDERCEEEDETDKYVEWIEACLYSEDCDIRESLWGHIEIQWTVISCIMTLSLINDLLLPLHMTRLTKTLLGKI